MEKIWPNFFIAGVHKGGTTSLYEYLRKIPGIYMSTFKEPHFFAPNVRSSPNYLLIHKEDEYLKLFQNASGYAAIGEASTSYMWDPDAPTRIRDKLPDSRIIIILRDPIKRAYSNYLMDVRDGLESLSFMEALLEDQANPRKGWGISRMYVERGLYYTQLKKYFDLFSYGVHVIFFEEFIKNPTETLLEIMKFLKVEGSLPDNIGIAYNAFYSPRNNVAKSLLRSNMVHKVAEIFPMSIQKKVRYNLLVKASEKPDISPEAITYLTEVYHDDIAKLRSLLKRDLPWSIRM